MGPLHGPRDFEGAEYMLNAFRKLGMETFTVPYILPSDWRPTGWEGSYVAANGTKINLTTLFPASGTLAQPNGITAEAVWVGIGDEADFIGKDVAMVRETIAELGGDLGALDEVVDAGLRG